MSASMTRTKTPEGGHFGPPKNGLEKPAAIGATILSDVADLIMGQSPPSSTYNDGGEGLPFFQGKTDFGFRHPVARLFCNTPLKIAQPDDILMSVRAPVGPTNIADRECCIGRGLAAIRPRNIHGAFLFFNLRYIETSIASLGSGSTFHAINKSQLASLEVNPHEFSLPEQRKIAGVLGVVQRAIEQQERLLALTAELKKALLHQLFTAGLRGEPQKQTEIGPMPESWEVRRLGDYARVLNGYAFKSHDYVKDGVRLIRISNVAIGTLIAKDDKYLPRSFLHEKAEYALEEGDLILSLTRPIIADGIKFCFVQKTDLPALLNQRVGKFQITSNKLLKDYLSHVLFSDYFTKPLRIMAEGSNQPNISPTRLENFLIPIPTNLKEQAEIAEVLTNLTKKAEFAQRKVLALTALFRTLLQQLMTAQIRVNNLDIDTSEMETVEQECKTQ